VKTAHTAIDGGEVADPPFPARDYFGPWPAVVVDTKDPEKRGRIKARAPQIWGDDEAEDEFVPDADLPWAFPSFPTHDLHVPEAGDGVILLFWGGSPTKPIWFGQFLGNDDAFAEFASSYTPEPKTRMLRTANGHVIEMRWVEDQEKIRVVSAGGLSFEMCDPTTVEGPKIKLALPDQKVIELDGLTNAINITAPTGTVNVLAPAGALNLTGQGVNVQSTGPFVSLIAGAANYTFAGILAFIVAGAFTIMAASVTVTAATIALAGVVSFGVAGTKYKLAHSLLFILLQDMMFVQATHTHVVTTAPGVTGVSSVNTVLQAGLAPRAGGLINVPAGLVSLDVNTMVAANAEAN